MGTKADNRTRLYALAGVFCFLLALSLVLLYVLRREDESGRRTLRTVMMYSHELHVPPAGATRLAVPMEEVPVTALEERVLYSFLTGVGGGSHPQRRSDVKYPDFKSDTPRFGQLYVGDGQSGWRLHFALDHSEGKPQSYDLLYLDEDCDSDLRNNGPRRPLKDPNDLGADSPGTDVVWFEPVKYPPFFQMEGRSPIELLPRLRMDAGGDPALALATTTIRKGRFEVEGKTYEAFLGYGRFLCDRLNRAASVLHLIREDRDPGGFVGAEELGLMRSLDGRWCRFSCTPTGDQLFVYPYEGPLGVLRLDAGGRKAGRLELWGNLRGPGARIALGQGLEDSLRKGADQYEIPVGDYGTESLDVLMGNVRFGLVGISYDDKSGTYRSEQAPCSILIREDKPFVLDFSHEPRVVFVRPPRKDRVARGDQVRIEAVLVDPGLGVMVRGLLNMTRSKTGTYTTLQGQTRTFDTAPLLAPEVVIRRADGQVVGKGAMPFG
jgi:hypothetical protein